ncbi:MAG: NAD(P)/FAD-dependent oxidoreductase [Planctomycetes bacterium]|nr:NAD(P)/FAD-dependent oxidoreductase [Planctomycetota bacterium]
MGSCYECRITIDGVEHERACLRGVAGCSTVGTSAETRHVEPRSVRSLVCDVLVIGAGPAGLAAAASAARRGKRTVLVDENEGLGGQIWRADRGVESERRRDDVRAAGVELLVGTSVVMPLGERRLRLAARDATIDARFEALVLATGATELLLPFPGWTLPNVFGLGGLQALAKGGLELAGKRVVLAGSGPLLLAVAAIVEARGARVVALAEQASRANVNRFGLALTTRPAKLLQALGYARSIAALRTDAWPVEAVGGERLRALVLRTPRGNATIGCDYAGVGFGLVPNGRLAAVLGCALDGRRVRVDALQRATVPWIFAAGECTGVGGKDKALVEGAIAGASAAGDPEPAQKLARARTRELAFAERIERAFAPRAELRALARPDTIVCRCEDVTRAEIAQPGTSPDDAWRSTKLQTRAGMGACQGRVCGPALEFLDGRAARDARPPLAPVTLDALAVMPDESR